MLFPSYLYVRCKNKGPLLDTGGSSNFYLDKSAERSPEAGKLVGTPNLRAKEKSAASSMVLLPKKRIKA